MITRRKYLKSSGILLSGITVGIGATKTMENNNMKFECKRPKLKDRSFTSPIIEKVIEEIKTNVKDEEISWLFNNCFPNTLDTTVEFSMLDGKPDTFVITGDIHAMWLRDSTAQVWPYIQFCAQDEQLKLLIAGVVNRQTKCINIDPYANAFNKGKEGSHWEKDLTEMKPELHERKWEIDSLCYAIRLAYEYWKVTGDISVFDDEWKKAMKSIYKTFIEQQRKEKKGPYKFQRTTSVLTDTVAGNGYGNPIKPVGLICSIFRPSDDSTIYPFLIPSNLFAVVSLRQLSEMFIKIIDDNEFAEKCESLAAEVEIAVQKYAVSKHLNYDEIFAFEVDGFGNRLFMDDSNIPSLLSLPYLGSCDKENKIYQNTRSFVLSEDNPYFFKGKYAEGIGGPHVGMDYIWHMSIIMRAMTSSDIEEIKDCIRTIKKTHADTGFMHEGFHKDDPSKFTRKWFAWVNTLFGELIYKLYKENPKVLQQI